MINQDKINNDQLAKSAMNEQIPKPIQPKQDPCVLQPLNHPRPAPYIISGFPVSRAQRMLQVALSINNGQQSQDKKQIYHEQKLLENQERARLALMQQVDLKNRKRSPKNKVLFSEPVVTNHFEYEPDVASRCDSLGEAEYNQATAVLNKMIRLHRKRQAAIKSSVRLHKEHVSESHGDEFAASSCEDDTKNIRKKRPYEMTVDNDDAETPSSSDSGQDDGGLFSSPKVAKIVPYYHDNMHVPIRGSENRSGHQSRRSPLFNKVSKVDSIDGLLGPLHEPSRMVVDEPQQSRDAIPELLNIEKFDDEESDQNDQDYFDALCIPPPTQSNYFSWLSSGLSFLTGKMNKLMS